VRAPGDQKRVEAVEAGAQRRRVDAQPKGGERRRDDGQQASEQDLRHAGGIRSPRDGGEEQRAAQRIVLEHHLPDAAQVDVDEAQDARGRTERFPTGQDTAHR